MIFSLYDWYEKFETKLLRLRIILKSFLKFCHFEPYFSYKKDSYKKKSAVNLFFSVNVSLFLKKIVLFFFAKVISFSQYYYC